MKGLRELVSKTVERELERPFPGIMAEVMSDRFRREPNRQLTALGFKWALVLGFEEACPGISRLTAITFADDCLEPPYGTPGCDWSAAGAAKLVRQYTETHGERT